MSATIEAITVVGENLTISLLVWRRFGEAIPDLVEQVYDMNPGLALLGPVLPLGTVVRVPIPTPRASRDITPVRLWE